MKVRILKLGNSSTTVEVEQGTTIEEACEKAEQSPYGYTVTLNGLVVPFSTEVGEGDIITLVPKVDGGKVVHKKHGGRNNLPPINLRKHNEHTKT